MTQNDDPEILLGVTGSIACYKACDITSALTQDGVVVRVVMTETAREMISPAMFHTLSQEDVMTDLFDEAGERSPAHIDVADTADLALIAPATANIIGKIASGIADDLLTSIMLAMGTRIPVLIAPAMNSNMYNNPIFQENYEKLEELGYQFIEPEEGYMACGDVGEGRLADTDRIINNVRDRLQISDEGPDQ